MASERGTPRAARPRIRLFGAGRGVAPLDSICDCDRDPHEPGTLRLVPLRARLEHRLVARRDLLHGDRVPRPDRSPDPSPAPLAEPLRNGRRRLERRGRRQPPPSLVLAVLAQVLRDRHDLAHPRLPASASHPRRHDELDRQLDRDLDGLEGVHRTERGESSLPSRSSSSSTS